MNRRVLIANAFGLSLSAIMTTNAAAVSAAGAQTIVPLKLSNGEWKKRLSASAYYILRESGTERPFSSPLLDEHRQGQFVCIACDLALFESKAKYDSGTGWPSFYQAIKGHILTKTDFDLIVPRTEYHCARCGGHHGHVFKDGPKPTGLRYCNNGAALKFVATKA